LLRHKDIEVHSVDEANRIASIQQTSCEKLCNIWVRDVQMRLK